MADETKSKPAADKNVAKEVKNGPNLKEAEKPAEGTVVEFNDKIWIESTGESRHMKKGNKYEVQRLHGEKLIAKGAAKLTTPPPKAQPKPAGKKNKNEDEDDD